jgi:transposase
MLPCNTIGGMSERFVMVDRDTPMMMPPSLQEWLPEGHLAYFVVETVALLPLHGFRVNTRGTGHAQFPPSMMLALLVYNYAVGRMSSRQIEKATYEDVASRYICGGDAHPDHDTICTFRRNNGALFEESFVRVLEYARETGVLSRRGGAAVDGTKIAANASKHAAVSHGRAGEMIEELKGEVRELVALAEKADREALPETLKVPEEIARRDARRRKLEEARRVIEARYKERMAEKQREFEEKAAERAARRERGERVRGPEPQPPPAEPEAKEQYNFTDPESRIMKAGNGGHFEQAYNAQAAVDTEGSMLVLGGYVTDAPNDKQQLEAAVDSVPPEVRELTHVLADTGYHSETAVVTVEADGGPTVYAAVEKTGHHRTVADLLAQPAPEEPPPGLSGTDAMRHRLRTASGRAAYKKRKETVEPFFGIVKAAMGFRKFLLRGLGKVNLEWTLVRLAYNFRRLATLLAAKQGPDCAPMTPRTA